MPAYNQTPVTEFILLGFPGSREVQILYFVIFLVIYILTITTNSIIIAIVSTDPHLHSPMYFFLSNFAFLEICYTTTTIPKMLSSFLTGNKAISYRSCIAQLCSFYVMASMEYILLTVMAFDRYVAICYPLQYGTIMNSGLCKRLAIGSWSSGFLNGLILSIPGFLFSFYGSNKIDHFFCDFMPLVKLASSDTVAMGIIFIYDAWFLVLSSLLLIAVSYCYIILTILRLPSATGRKKAFSTCASHLAVVLIFFGTVIFFYLRLNPMQSFEVDKAVALIFLTITPLLNPLIYSLRNKEVLNALRRAWGKISS
ncbi:olfactory receptor 6F1-like [Rhinatrema bivittatum]|uniref:olfactory receptor 6F1-like n=1 Tax=Rhinatrema bivittatum TaxID=194408 RepID=UPI001126700C|nr:olfactory receptor 6F1-like [Rhinatrema bivittatum]